MRQEEVDLIYDYLHENFKYKNGELIAIKTSRGKVPIGTSIGSFNYKRNSGEPIISCSLTVNSKRYVFQLKHLIYIFHHKIKPKNILHIDGNPTNCNIKNLKATDNISKFIMQKDISEKKSGATPYVYNGKTRYRVRLSTDEGRFTIGSYSDEKTAIKCYEYAKKLYMKKNLSNQELKYLANKKYAPNEHKKNKLKGVTPVKSGKFKAVYIKDGFRKHIGTYETDIEAHLAYNTYKKMIESI